MTTNQIDPRLVHMREVLLVTVAEKYQALVETINKLPLVQEYKVQAVNHIGSGFLWAKEGISVVQFNFDAPPAPVTPPTDPVETPEKPVEKPAETSPEDAA